MESVYDRTARSLAAIGRRNAELRACTMVRQEALIEALELDRAAANGGGRGALHGWTLAVKDNMDVAGTVRTDGLGPPYRPPAQRDATGVARLRAAGAVVVAKTNLEELSFGATTQNAWWGACRNPWDLTRLPGGSSGGSAVAVAAGLVDVALGTDTGGSVRNPAAFCGICGLRPSRAMVPRGGVSALSPEYDSVGPMARSVREVRTLLEVLSERQMLAHRATGSGLRGLRVGIPPDDVAGDVQPGIRRGIIDLLELLKDQGAQAVPVTLRGADRVRDAYQVLGNVQAARELREHWDDPRLSDGIRARVELGRRATPEERAKAARAADAWRANVSRALGRVDLIAMPATPFVAPRADDSDLVAISREINRCNAPWSLVPSPALVLPVTPDDAGLPVAAELIGRPGGDARLLAVGEVVQAHSTWHERRPPEQPVATVGASPWSGYGPSGPGA